MYLEWKVASLHSFPDGRENCGYILVGLASLSVPSLVLVT